MIAAANYGVYGVRKLPAELRRTGIDIGRDQVARLMLCQGLRGVRRGKAERTTLADPGACRPVDLVSTGSPPPPRIGCGSAT